MKINVDENTLVGHYDERGLDACVCGCNLKIISKKMFVDFLQKNYPDIDAEATITSMQDHTTNRMIVNIELIQQLSEKSD